MQAGEGQREGDTESEAGSTLWDVITEPDVGLKLMNRDIMTWAEISRLTDWATQAPLCPFPQVFKNVSIIFLNGDSFRFFIV